MARRSLRSIAGLLANPRGRRRAARNAKGQFISTRKAARRRRSLLGHPHGLGAFTAKSGASKHRSALSAAAKRRIAARRKKAAVFASVGKRPRQKGHFASRRHSSYPERDRYGRFVKNPGRRARRSRSNPAFVSSIQSSVRKLPVVGKFLSQAVGFALPVAAGGYVAPMAVLKADAWLAGKTFTQALYKLDPRVRWFLFSAIAGALAAKVSKYVGVKPDVAGAAVAAGVFGTYYGVAVGSQPASAGIGALVLSGSNGQPIGALNVPGYSSQLGMATAYDIGPAPMGAVVLGSEAF